MRNVTRDIREEEKAEHAQQLADWKASQETAAVETNREEEVDDFDDDPVLRELETRRRDALKARFSKEKEFHAQGHGEYREIVEEEFLKEVCGSEHVVVHFYHQEFIRCKVMDKRWRQAIAQERSVSSSPVAKAEVLASSDQTPLATLPQPPPVASMTIGMKVIP